MNAPIHKQKLSPHADPAFNQVPVGQVPMRTTWCEDEYPPEVTSYHWSDVTCEMCLQARDQGSNFLLQKTHHVLRLH